MTDIPPPPPPPGSPFGDAGPTPRPATAPARRPGAVTGAAGILIVAGALSLVIGLMAVSGDGLDIEVPFADAGSVARVVGFVLVVQGGLSLLAGLLVLRLRPAGRVLGIVIACLGLVSGLATLRSTGSSGLLALALDAFVLYALLAYGFVFRDRVGAR
jgi:hypothetical protein